MIFRVRIVHCSSRGSFRDGLFSAVLCSSVAYGPYPFYGGNFGNFVSLFSVEPEILRTVFVLGGLASALSTGF